MRSVQRTKKYLAVSICLVVFSLLLMALSGCDATSSPPEPLYSPTGSWQGTIGNDKVRGGIDPDGSYHLAIVDDTGAFIPGAGEYTGQILGVNRDNIGSMTRTKITSTQTGYREKISFKLRADTLESVEGVHLTRTSEGDGPATLSALRGRWGLSSEEEFQDIIVDDEGAIRGYSGSNTEIHCQYTGSLKLVDPQWNLYHVDMTLADYSQDSCQLLGDSYAGMSSYSYSGFAMLLGNGTSERRLWLTANNPDLLGIRTFSREWSVQAYQPEPKMSILGERPGQRVLVVEGAELELDGQESRDGNRGPLPLTYAWSGSDPDGMPLLFSGATGAVTTFVPQKPGDYSLTLAVSDGVSSAPLSRTVTVAWTPGRFVDQEDGTILDTKTNLLWLRDAGCATLNLDGTIWGVSATVAKARVEALADGRCGLRDGSGAGEWRLPKAGEFSRIIDQDGYESPPALLGNREAFVNVGTTNNATPIYWYWAEKEKPAYSIDWYCVDLAYSDPNRWGISTITTDINSVWPLRAFRPGEQNP